MKLDRRTDEDEEGLRKKVQQLEDELANERMVVDALQDKNRDLKGESEVQKKLFSAPQSPKSAMNAVNPELEQKIRELQRSLDRALEENRDLKLAANEKPAAAINMPSLNSAANKGTSELEEELTVFKNQDRVIREKCTQLEM